MRYSKEAMTFFLALSKAVNGLNLSDFNNMAQQADLNLPDADFDDFEGLQNSLNEKVAAHQATEVIYDWESALWNLQRQDVRDDLTRPEMSTMCMCCWPEPEIWPEPEWPGPDENWECLLFGEGCIVEPVEPIVPPEPYIVPLKDVFVEASLNSASALATIDFKMTYINPGDKPILTAYEFPLDKDVVLSNVKIRTASGVIEAEIQEKEQAKQNFDQTVERGDAGVYVERDEGDEFMQIRIGNLLPGDEIEINARMILGLQVVNDAWSFVLPVSFYPNYSRFGFSDLGSHPYKFGYAITVGTTDGITLLSAPSGAVVEYESSGKFATIFNDEADRSIEVFFRSNDMLEPKIIQATNESFPGEVAEIFSFTPNFAGDDDS